MAANMTAAARRIRTAGAGTVLVAVLLTVLGGNQGACAAWGIVRNITISDRLNHMVVDSTGYVYLGAVNALYKLKPDLTTPIKRVQTGPIMDHINCEVLFNNSTTKCGYSTKVLTDNHNKVLIVDKDNARLVTCGSVQQGTCQIRNLSNIGDKQDFNNLQEQYVAANDATSSTVAFIAPGPLEYTGAKVLYSATTFTKPELIRMNVPIVAARKLTGRSEEVLTFAYKHQLSFDGSFLKMVKDYHKFNITYVAGFNVGIFNYFLSVQRKHMTSRRFVTKIIRTCGNDSYLRSYVEMPLQCNEYNLLQAASVTKAGKKLATQLQILENDNILVAAFAKEEPLQDDSQQKKSYSTGICVYSFSKIDEQFVKNIQSCFRGKSEESRLVNHITGSKNKECIASPTTTVNSGFCGISGQNPINNYINGSTAMSSSPVINYGMLITAVAVSVIEEHTIAFLGTSNGTLKKLVVESDGAGTREFDKLDISVGHPILRDMKFAPDKLHLYVMTSNMIFMLKVSNCSRHTNCEACAQMSCDPYCGWCSLRRECTKKAFCDNSSMNNFWLTNNSWGCVQVNYAAPNHASLATQVPVMLNVAQLPAGDKTDYVCMFGTVEVPVTTTDMTQIQCTTPPSGADLPQIDAGQDHVNVTLGIKSVATQIIFVETLFSFYNCSLHRSCMMCTMARWGCKWCIYDNKCISDMESCSNQKAGISKPRKCPQLLVPRRRILVPVGYKSEISLRGINLPQVMPGQGGYQCIFRHQSPPDITKARLIKSTIVCSAKEHTYRPEVSEQMSKVDVVWNNNFYITDENDVQVTFYKCEVMGEDCSLCMSLADTKPKYNCTWCGNAKCLFRSVCPSRSGSRLVQQCPKPKLHGVSPLTGPLGGNTSITITGSNLGKTFEQIDGSVTVAGRPCRAERDGYKTARKIVCMTSSVRAPTEGPIVVRIGDTNETWGDNFKYQDPKLESIHPMVGPVAGGTEITVTGRALNTGVRIKVMLDSLPCTLNQEPSFTMLTCLTCNVPKPRTTTSLTVSFDYDEKKLLSGVLFNYTFNPNITKIYPRASYLDGGRILTVEGRMFDIIQAPKMFFISGNVHSDETICQRVDDTQMMCKTPDANNLMRTHRHRRRVQEMPVRLGFRMDGVAEVADLNNMPWVDGKISIYANPTFSKISNSTDGKKEYTGGALVIKGEGLDLASTKSEIRVNVGRKKCKILSLTDTTLVCHPPSAVPSAKETPLVVVKIGNAEYIIGKLEYKSPKTSNKFPEKATIGIAITGSILVLIIIFILIVYRRKSTEAERQFRKLQIQLDTLESNVRNECKQAFAELQTEVTDLTSDLNVTGIPFWDYKTYTFKVLFPSHTDHPVLHNKLDQMHNSTMKRPAGQELGLQQFNQLLNSRQFLITFIRTLEAQRNFSIRDKAVVASLLMIVLQDKMEYATEILKVLLSELIDKSVENKHPKLMLRRTESVVEKFLTNWLSICMYSYLKKHAGKSMFLLYKAIKHQTEKGPVDAITSEARYSLSEDRLLREKIEPKTLTINLVVEHEAEMVTCKVLDCDTITQAKEKCLDAIYMNTPCSRRPAVYDVDLEWRSGRSGHLPLQDEDVTTQLVSEWKRINTLAHYHVPDGAIMAISPTRNKNDLIRHQHGMVEITPGSPFSGIKPIVTVEEGHKVWHLVKHDDPQNQSRTQKVISEIFLTRLLSTKGTLQQFIDDLFLMILKVDNSVPPAIKYLFDFLDQAARRHNIADSEVVHTWKSNSLPLRFWVNLIKNPEFVFDIRKSNIVDSCLSVIAQTFMDSCSTMEHRLGKDSPSNKLLFARDIPKYRKWVEKFYKDVAEMAPVSDHEMNDAMIELSTQNVVDFNVPCALKELYRYALQYNVELLEALDEDTSARKLHLANKFEQVTNVMDGTPLY